MDMKSESGVGKIGYGTVRENDAVSILTWCRVTYLGNYRYVLECRLVFSLPVPSLESEHVWIY